MVLGSVIFWAFLDYSLYPISLALLNKGVYTIGKGHGDKNPLDNILLKKEIAKSCSIHKNISFHVARYTFATTVMLSNGVPIETVSRLLGHAKLSTTQICQSGREQKKARI